MRTSPISRKTIMHQLLANRPQSGFPVSIATGLALETLFTPVIEVYDDTRQVNNLADLSTYNLYAFNVATLLRNIISTLKFDELLTVPKKDVYEALLEEVEFLTQFFESNNVPIQFYLNTYTYVKQTYEKQGNLRKSTTDKQIFTDSVQNYCLDAIRKQDEVTVFHKDIHFGKELSTLVFTHVPFDLISYNNFRRLDLLESHTGLIKSRKEWNTKYFKLPGERDMSFLPFFEFLLAKFGDHVMFSPAPLKERLEIYEAMKKKKVHPLMTELSLIGF